MRNIVLDTDLNKCLQDKGYVKIGKMPQEIFLEFKAKSAGLIAKYKKAFPDGILFNLINAPLEIKTESNFLVEQYLNTFLCQRLNLNNVDIYPVSHILKPFGLNSGIWHQDSAVVNEQVDFSLNAWMPLTDVHLLNGCLWIIPRTHFLTNFKRQFGRNPINNAFLYKTARYFKPLFVEAGEVLLFYRNTIHGSSSNLLPFPRLAAESLVVSKSAQLVNFHRDINLAGDKILEFKVSKAHFLKANPKDDFYSGETPFVTHDDESDDAILNYLLNFVRRQGV